MTFNSRNVIAAAIESAQRAAAIAEVDLDVVIVDNASADGSADLVEELFPTASVIRNGDNRGFGAATNQGLLTTDAEWGLLLNPDASLADDALRLMFSFVASTPRVGAVAPAVSGAGTERAESAGMQPGLRAAAGHFLLLNRLIPGDRGGPWRGFQLHRLPGIQPRPVEWASASALLVRSVAAREIGGFDPTMFLYAEDVDLGRRMMDRGWEIWLVPAARASHSVAGSQGGVTPLWFQSLHVYYARQAGALKLVAFDLIAAVGLGFRGLAAFAQRTSPDSDLHRSRMLVTSRAAFGLAIRTIRGGKSPS